MKTGGMKSFLLVIVLAATAAINPGLYGSSPRLLKVGPAREASPEMTSREPVEVLNVVSGDTLLVIRKGRRMLVGLRGVKTSDIKGPRSREAARLLWSLVKDKSIELGFGLPREMKQDARGRLIGYLFADGESVNQKMVNAGWTSDSPVFHAPVQEAPRSFAPHSTPVISESPTILSTQQKTPEKKKAKTADLSSQIVYITPHDKTYHKAQCRLLQNVRAVRVLKSQAIRMGYKRCSRCKP
jgi:endonuclease YncB( thermonuclease family)